MHETRVSEEVARNYIQYLCGLTWKKMNKDRVAKPPLSNETLIGIAINFARMGQCCYQHGDGLGNTNRETKDRVLSLLIQSFPLDV